MFPLERAFLIYISRLVKVIKKYKMYKKKDNFPA